MRTPLKRETRRVLAWAWAIIVLSGSMVSANGVPQAAREADDSVSGQPRLGRYQLIVTGEMTDGKGNAKGLLNCSVMEDGVFLMAPEIQMSNIPVMPVGTVAMHCLRHPSSMLRLPILAGEEWTDRWTGYEATTCVLAEADPISLELGSFPNCLLIQTTIRASATPNSNHGQAMVDATCGKRSIWLAPGVGIMRMRYEHKDGTTSEMLLKDYNIGADTQEYLPTVHNATWTYLFKNDGHAYSIQEQWRLSDRRQAGLFSFKALFPKPPARRPGQSEAAYQAALRAHRAMQARDRARRSDDNDKPPVKRPGQSEAAYQAALRAYRAKQARSRVRQGGDKDALPVKRAGESEAAYQARLRAYRARRATSRVREDGDQDAPPVKHPGQSEAAYQAALRAYRAQQARSQVSHGDDQDLPPVKRAGESEAAYQARLRAHRARQARSRVNQGGDQDAPPVKRAGESEAAYQARLRAYRAKRAGSHVSQGGDQDAPPLKRAGESEAAYQARLRAYVAKRVRSHTSQGADQDGPPIERPGHSEAAYQAALRAYRAKAARGGQIAPPVKRAGQSEAAYQAALRAYRARQAKEGTVPDALVGKPLPEFKDLGFELSADSAAAEMILVCVFDTQQRPARNCVAQLTKQARALRQRGIRVCVVQGWPIGQDVLDKWVKENGVPFPVGMLSGDVKAVQAKWGVQSMPWLILTDRDHIVRAEGFELAQLADKIMENEE